MRRASDTCGSLLQYAGMQIPEYPSDPLELHVIDDIRFDQQSTIIFSQFPVARIHRPKGAMTSLPTASGESAPGNDRRGPTCQYVTENCFACKPLPYPPYRRVAVACSRPGIALSETTIRLGLSKRYDLRTGGVSLAKV